MWHHTLAPPPELADVVEQLWLYEDYCPLHRFERVFPSGTIEIVINLTDGELRCYDPQPGRPTRLRGAIVTGVHRRYFVIDTQQQSTIMGVHLKPGGAWRLLGIPASELTDTHIEMEALLGAEARRLVAALSETSHPHQRLQLVARALSRRLRKEAHPAVTWATAQFCRYPESVRVATIADEAGLSMRRFNELFTREVGLNPKGFVRIRRFQSTLARIHEGATSDWSLLAVERGYADQAHLIRDFREFTGLTPTEYARFAALPAMNHVPLSERGQICPLTAAG